jgi:hypothetical protein
MKISQQEWIEIDKNIAQSLEQIERGEYVEMNDEFWENMKIRVQNRVASAKNKLL